jgi:hypothetical protein
MLSGLPAREDGISLVCVELSECGLGSGAVSMAMDLHDFCVGLQRSQTYLKFVLATLYFSKSALGKARSLLLKTRTS